MAKPLGTGKKIGFSLAAVALALAALEGGARLAEWAVPGLGEPRPAIGPKPPGGFRIFVYGGSTVHGVPPEFGFVSQLELWLRTVRPGRPVEVHNFGVPGATSRDVLRTLERTIGEQPDLVIVLSGHNEFLRRRVTGLRERLLERSATARVMERLARGAARQQVMPRSLEPYDRDEPLFARKVRDYEANIRAIVDAARDGPVPLMLVTAPANLLDWPPVYKRLSTRDAAYERHVAEVQALLDTDLAAAERRLDTLLADYPDDAMLLYLRGLARAAAGDAVRARELLVRAKDLDPLPWRALGRFNETVRQAAGGGDVLLVDAERLLADASEGGLVGYALFEDNCHPNLLGNAIIAREIVRVMGSRGLLLNGATEPMAPEEWVDYYVSRAMTPQRFRKVELESRIDNAVYAMKTPFFNHAASEMYLREALLTDEHDWRIWANLATLALLRDDLETGRRYLERAVELKGGPLDPEDRVYTPYLKEALQRLE